MPLRQTDPILRLIEEMADVIERIRVMLEGDDRDPTRALEEILAARTALLADREQLLEQLDEATAVVLIADSKQLPVWIELVRLEAKASRLLGQDARADECERRARRLEEAAATLPPSG